MKVDDIRATATPSYTESKAGREQNSGINEKTKLTYLVVLSHFLRSFKIIKS
jgi:hypothetical protein